jgi:hypothetical protein
MHGSKVLSHEGCVCVCNCMFACIHEAFYCLLVLCQFCLWRCAGWMCISMITWWRRNLQASAKAFLNECKVSSDPVGMLHTCSTVWRWLFSRNKIMLMAFCLTAASCWGMCCSYWCTWWFSVWMAVSLLGYPCRLYQWGAFRSGSFLYWGEFWCSNFGGYLLQFNQQWVLQSL